MVFWAGFLYLPPRQATLGTRWHSAELWHDVLRSHHLGAQQGPAHTWSQAAPFPAVVLEARADLGSWDGAHGVTAGEEVRDFSESHVSSQPAHPDHGGQQTADHRAVTGPR